MQRTSKTGIWKLDENENLVFEEITKIEEMNRFGEWEVVRKEEPKFLSPESQGLLKEAFFTVVFKVERRIPHSYKGVEIEWYCETFRINVREDSKVWLLWGDDGRLYQKHGVSGVTFQAPFESTSDLIVKKSDEPKYVDKELMANLKTQSHVLFFQEKDDEGNYGVSINPRR